MAINKTHTLLDHNNAIIETTFKNRITVIERLAKYQRHKVLLLTQNRELKDQLKKLNIKNLNIYSFHSFCNENYIECRDDMSIMHILNGDQKLKKYYSYGTIVIDDAQDINSLYIRLIEKIMMNNSGISKIYLLEDKQQCIFGSGRVDEMFCVRISCINSLSWSRINADTDIIKNVNHINYVDKINQILTKLLSSGK